MLWSNLDRAMGGRGGAAADAMVGAHPAAVTSRAHPEAISWRRVLRLVADGFWFFITASLAFLFRFMTAKHFSAASGEESLQHPNLKSSPAQPPVEVTEHTKSREESSVGPEGEEEAPIFRFRFSFGIPGDNYLGGVGEVQGTSDGKDAFPFVTSSISSSYRFHPDRDFSGFLETPQAKIMSVQESYVGSAGVIGKMAEQLDEELRGRVSALRCSDGDDSIAGSVNKSVLFEDFEVKKSERLNVELGHRLSSLKYIWRTGDAGDGEAEPCRGPEHFDGVCPQEAGKLDRELKTRLSAVKYLPKRYLLQQDREGPPVFSSTSTGGGVLDVNGEELNRELVTRLLSVKSTMAPGVEAATSGNVSADGLSPGSLYESEGPEGLGSAIRFMEDDDQLELDSPSFTSETCSLAGPFTLSQWSITGGLYSDGMSDNLSDGYSVKDLNLDFDSDEFLTERDFEPEVDTESLFEWNREKQDLLESTQETKENHLFYPQSLDTGSFRYWVSEDVEFAEDADGEAESDLGEDPGTPDSDIFAAARFLSSKAPLSSESPDHLQNYIDEPEQRQEGVPDDDFLEQVTDHPKETSDWGRTRELRPDDPEVLESLWEHQYLIEQLSTDLKKAKSMGMPTILEESESPRAADDLKPCKFDARFLSEDPMDELNKFYKSYWERMRKFDILNFQKMYAVGFLRLNDPLQSMGTQKPFVPTMASLLSHNVWPRRRKSGGDRPQKFVRELRSDLEMVYVGQSCLSWEFLRWQYERTRELLDPELNGGHRYNHVAGEFQQFQVLIQRFLENEPFLQENRVLNYAKNRCVNRSLLQVPVVREDRLKGKTEENRSTKWASEDAVAGDELESAMEESIRVFWDFIKADRDETPAIVKGLVGAHVELQDPTDRRFMTGIQADLHKKQKKLRDLTRVGNCLVNKFKKSRRPDGRSLHNDLLFSQVDLKLVSRVLRMPRITTDQLVWCHAKLSKISFVDRKLVREPSFSLFPCA